MNKLHLRTATIKQSYYVEVCRISSLYSILSVVITNNMDKEKTITDMDKSINFSGSFIDRDL